MTEYDVVVIGAGIHGAGVAQAAAAAGYSVCVLEQSAIASGTSSRSSKLIHGGLRYLESYQFGLVRECLHERDLLLKLAPELIQLKPFYIPVYKQTSRSGLVINLGLTTYALLNGFKASSRFSRVQKTSWDKLDGLTTKDLLHVFRYHDAQTDDKALTQAVIRSAQSMGAVLFENMQVIQIERNDSGCEIYCLQKERQFSFKAKFVVNAAGPWVNNIIDLVTPEYKGLGVDLVQGAHIVIDQAMDDAIYYLESPSDGRAVFVMPWKNKTMVGTTETMYEGDPAKVKALQHECEYLLQVLSHYFPGYSTVSLEQTKAFAGLRVLPAAKGDPFSRHRETILEFDDEQKPTLLSIYGGKLTVYRMTAEQVMKRIIPYLPVKKKIADTKKLTLKK